MKRDVATQAKRTSRRGVLAGMAGMAAVPAIPLLACEAELAVENTAQSTGSALSARARAPERFVEEFVAGYNAKDIRRILRLLARDATWTVNGELELEGRGAIGDFLVDYGAERDAGSVANGRMINEVSFFGDDSALFEGRIMAGVHGELAGFPVAERSAQIAYGFFCFLDERGRCSLAQVMLDWGSLSPDF